MVKNTIRLDFSADTPVLHVKKGDSGARRLVFLLTDGGEPVNLDGDSVTTVMRARQGSSVYMTNCSMENGCPVCRLKGDYTQTPGELQCELTVYKGSGDDKKVLYSPTFILSVEDNLYSDSQVEADDRFSALGELVNEASASAAQAAASAEQCSSKADISYVDGRFDALDPYYSKTETDEMLAKKAAAPEQIQSSRRLRGSAISNEDRIGVYSTDRKLQCFAYMKDIYDAVNYSFYDLGIDSTCVMLSHKPTSPKAPENIDDAIFELYGLINDLSTRLSALES